MIDTPRMFTVDDVVQRVNQAEAVGTVIAVRPNPQTGACQYLVQFAFGQRVVAEEGLRRFTPRETPWDELSNRAFSGIEHFICTLTYHRLRYPPARIARSFATARTQFYPHQFKPLLKFLDNPGKRLLIADDVGLGKTIEAGYILRELDFRHGRLDRVLVVVPARLTHKWRRELKDRFDEHFDIVKKEDLLRQADVLRHDRIPDTFRWIISYESARDEEVIAALQETQLPLDLLIADEAHRLRNPETLQHKMGSALCQCSDTVLFLSATPVMTSRENLWNLLRLLSPDEFQEWPVFEQQMRANHLLLSAQRALARNPPNLDEARRHFHRFIADHTSETALQGQFLQSILGRIEDSNADHDQLLELQADIGLLSPTGHIIARTRKAEALPNRPIRDAAWSRVVLSPDERSIYDSVEELCRMAWPAMGDFGFRMSLLMAYRITASCIPAAMDYFRDKLEGSVVREPQPFADELEEDDAETGGDMTAWNSPETRARLLAILAGFRSEAMPDSKLESLMTILQKIAADDIERGRKRRKVVVFSYFRRTLEYLRGKLAAAGIENRMIHGLVPVEDREYAIDDFLQSENVRVLLTSEVGGEGIDLQAACVVINYDLPWNPMVVEQRIGRIDRIGQESSILYIFNLIVQDSIEEYILARLLERIEVFRQSIGELDEIIGTEIERLAERAIRGELTPEQLEQVLEQTTEAIGNRVHSAQQMLTQVDGLLAADQALIQEINAVAGERQLPSENELLLYLNRFLGSRFPGCVLPARVARDVVEVDLHGPLGPAIESTVSQLGEDVVWFGRKIATGNVALTLSRDAAYRHHRAELVHLQHPLCRFVVSEDAESTVQSLAFCLELTSSRLSPSTYVFLLTLLHIHGQRPVTKMVALLTPIEGTELLSEPEQTTPILIELLDLGRDSAPPSTIEPELTSARDRLLDGLEKFKADLEARERKVDLARREQRLTSQVASLDFRIHRAEETCASLIRNQARDFAIRMAKARVEKAMLDKENFLASIPTETWEPIEHEEVAVGLLIAKEPQSGN